MSAASSGSGFLGSTKSSLPSYLSSRGKKKIRQHRGCPLFEMGLQVFAQLLTEQKELVEIQERVRKDLGEGC